MRKTIFFLAAAVAIVATPVRAAIIPLYGDIKLGSQQVVEKQAFGTPAAADTTSVLNANAGASSAAAATVSPDGQPDVPRNLVVTPGGTTNDVNTCVIAVSGTNFYYHPISENFTFASQASTAQTGSKAFRTVTSIAFPANCEKGGFAATWSIGGGEKIGLKNCLASTGDWLQSSVAGAHESTLATLAVDSSHVESNTADFAGTMNGSNSFTGYFFQNFQCIK